MGREWYEDQGKYFTKMNTFHVLLYHTVLSVVVIMLYLCFYYLEILKDFADCAKHLIATGVTSSDRLAIVGRSAGGLLVTATVNMYPELFRTAVAAVPFVDALNTMADPTIPLTVSHKYSLHRYNYDNYTICTGW